MSFENDDIPYSLADYLQLVDATGRVIIETKRGYIPSDLPDILLKYRVHETQVSNVYNEEQFLIDKKVKQNLFLKYFNIKVEDSILNLFDKKELAEEDSLSLSKFYLQLIDRNNLLKLFDKEWFIGKFRKSIRNAVLSLKTIPLTYFFKLLKSKVFLTDIFTLRQRIFVISKIRI